MLGFVRNHLDPSKMLSQANGGASNTSEKTNGAATRISFQYPLALYTHCTSQLNLAVVASFEEVSICNMIGVVKRLSILFFCTPEASEEVGRSYTEHPARIECVEAQRSLQNKMDWMDRASDGTKYRP